MKKLLTALVVLVLAAPLSAQISARRANAARQDEDINAAAAALNRAFVDATPAKRSIICTSAGIVC